MYLKSLQVFGFKSFADKTRFDFVRGMTGVVGPNGCGKSNVVDATKWVLGEQSARSLRGKEMTDVIFNGSATRKKLNYAEVELVFDNSSRKLNLDYDEVAVKRRLYRDGTSEYYINGQRALLRQIRELFMDTGIGTSTYSMIEQGRISEFLAANAKDRRQVFEEAAGISKYKISRMRAQRSLERVQHNLDRLDDVVGEVYERLKKVERQAAKARRYRAIEDELKGKRLELALFDFGSLNARHDELKLALDAAVEKERSLEADLSMIQATLVRHETAGEELERDLNDADQALAVGQQEIVELEQNIKYGMLRADELAELRSRALREAQEADERRETAKIEREHALQDCVNLAIELEIIERQSEIFVQSLAESRDALEELAEKLEKLQAESRRKLSERADIHNELVRAESDVRLLDARRIRAVADLDAATEQGAEARRREQDFEAALARSTAQHHALRDSRSRLADFRQQLDDRRHTIRSMRDESLRRAASVRTRLTTIRDMVQRHEGMNAGVRAILSAVRNDEGNRFEVIGVVADLVRVAPEFERAVEVAFGAALQNIVVKSDAGAKAAINYLKRDRAGRVTFLPLNRIRPRPDVTGSLRNKPGCLGIASDLVSCDDILRPAVQSLLGGTLVFKDLDSAVAAGRNGQYGLKLVTLDGELLHPGGAITGGQKRGNPVRFLSRKNEIDELDAEYTLLAARVRSFETQLEAAQRRRESIARELEYLDRVERDVSQRETRLTEQLRQAAEAASEAARRVEVIESEITGIDADIRSGQARLAEFRAKLSDYDDGEQMLDGRIRALSVEYDALQAARADAETRQADARVTRARLVEKRRAAQSHYHQSDRMLKDAATLAVQRRADYDSMTKERESLLTTLRSNRTSVADLLSRRDALADKRNQIYNARQTLRESISEGREHERRLRAGLNDASKELGLIRERESDVRIRLESLVERIRVQLDVDLPGEYKRLDGRLPNVTEELREDVQTLERRLKNLGNVSMYAIDEFDELSKRYEFLKTQQEDLTHARDQLRHIINTINSKSRKMFADTFEKVRQNFQVMFHKLFNGGKADILLEEGVDVLEAGIEIVARPPGKEPASIDQLSGGEKALTTLTLIFSIYQLKPSPFCILDEVDAPLDESNVDRFNLVLREFLDRSQFIVITHNKKTMSYADTIYGVTMQERGVSKKISINFEELAEQEELAMAGD